MKIWIAGKNISLLESLISDKKIHRYLDNKKLKKIFDLNYHTKKINSIKNFFEKALSYYNKRSSHNDVNDVKFIDIKMESSHYKFKLNIRDTQGRDGYPTRLMCDFTKK